MPDLIVVLGSQFLTSSAKALETGPVFLSLPPATGVDSIDTLPDKHDERNVK